MHFIEKNMYTVKGILRVSVRILIETLHRLVLNIFDTLFGFLLWPQKKMRIKIFILKDQQNNPIVSTDDLDAAIKYAIKVFKEKFNVALLPAGNGSFVEISKTIFPAEVLHTKGGSGALAEEFKIAGNYFDADLISPIYPVTTFVVIDIDNATGCSLGPMTDYVTLSHDGAKNESVLAHELAHACALWHVNDRSNLLWNRNDRGDKIKWWQKNIFRSSRHITYW